LRVSLSLSLSLRKYYFDTSIPWRNFKNQAIFHEMGTVNIQNEKPESKDFEDYIFILVTVFQIDMFMFHEFHRLSIKRKSKMRNAESCNFFCRPDGTPFCRAAIFPRHCRAGLLSFIPTGLSTNDHLLTTF
jgi:hypothetical protein